MAQAILRRGIPKTPYAVGFEPIAVEWTEITTTYDEFFSKPELVASYDMGLIVMDTANAPALPTVNFDLTVGNDENLAYGYRNPLSDIEPYGDISEGQDTIMALKTIDGFDKTELVLVDKHWWIESVTLGYDGKEVELTRELDNGVYKHTIIDATLSEYIVNNNGQAVAMTITATI